ncbi:MAG: sigma-70 family RNA polymerase sigma factor [Myxococcales bacterium]|nr:sigma-70 family RNA polymerase sigma factor [Myxococcales bacterium]MCB9583423.1 sigma-70 family RNA polymerase sigma factor [Polyangiaceae bacterium]
MPRSGNPRGTAAVAGWVVSERETVPKLADPASRDDAGELPIYGRDSFWDLSGSMDDAEERFILRLRQHDERAFNELVELYEQRVFRLVFRMLGRRDEAEDMAQEVFVQVFKAIGTFRGDSKLSTWVYRIAVNLCKNRIKYLSRRHDGQQQELEPVAERAPLSEAKGVTYGDVARPDHMVEGFQVERIVQVCIAELDADFRDVLVLRDVEDLSYEEIAQITGLPDGTVKSRIHRARGMLKSKVERALGEKIR